ncbi:hypothetical protein LguiA_021116 [Lonicera macranthoides]
MIDFDKISISPPNYTTPYPSILLKREYKASLELPCSKAVILKILGRSLFYTVMQNRLKSMWKSRGEISLMDLEYDFFLFKCEDIDTKDRALIEVLWIIQGNYVAVHKWKPGFKAFTGTITSTCVWICIPELPAELYTYEVLFFIGSCLGRPHKVEDNTFWVTSGRFARCSVKVAFGKPDISKILVDDIMLNRLENLSKPRSRVLKGFKGVSRRDSHRWSYGSTLRYKSVQRLKPVGKHSLIGGSGEIRDFQAILRKLDELNYKDRRYLLIKEATTITWQLDLEITLPAHFCAKNGMLENLSLEDGVKLLEKCMLVLLYRDRSAVNKLQLKAWSSRNIAIPAFTSISQASYPFSFNHGREGNQNIKTHIEFKIIRLKLMTFTTSSKINAWVPELLQLHQRELLSFACPDPTGV